MPEQENPFQETLLSRHRAEPCTVVIFGATGDLTHRKLIPAILQHRRLPVTCRRSSRWSALPGAKRRMRVFRAELETGNRKNSRQGHNDELWGSFRAMHPLPPQRIRRPGRLCAAQAAAGQVRQRTRHARQPLVLPRLGPRGFQTHPGDAPRCRTQRGRGRQMGASRVRKAFRQGSCHRAWLECRGGRDL
jgi:hypothetical protein